MQSKTHNPEKGEEKAQYFAQYWKQPVQRYNNDFYIKEVNGFIDDELLKGDYLLLKPLSAITDEDAIEVAKMSYKQNTNWTVMEGKLYIGDNFTYDKATRPVSTLMQVVDYLRSKGYALPFRNYSVEQLIEMGWLKLTQR